MAVVKVMAMVEMMRLMGLHLVMVQLVDGLEVCLTAMAVAMPMVQMALEAMGI